MNVNCNKCGCCVEKEVYVCPTCKHPIYENLIRDALEKKEEATVYLINMNQNRLYHLAYKEVKDTLVAEELVQDAFIKGLNQLSTLKDPNKFESWITTITINKCRDYLKTKKNTQFVDFTSMQVDSEDQFSEEWVEDESIEFQPEANFDYRELKEGLYNVLDELPERQKTALLLQYMDGFKISEISEILDIPDGTVKSLLHAGKKAIKSKIENLRKQNKSFYGIAPIPFLMWALRDDLKVVHTINAEEVVQKVLKAGEGAQFATQSDQLMKTTSSSIKKEVVKNSALGTVSKTVSSKVVVGLVSAAIIGSAAVGGYSLLHRDGVNENAQISKDEKLTKYSVVNDEIPQFEMTPIDNDMGNGYLVKVDDLYGFINPKGHFDMYPSYEGVMLYDMDGVYGSDGFDICMFPEADRTDVSDGTRVEHVYSESRSQDCGHGFGGMGFPSYLTPDNRVISSDMSDSIYEAQLKESIIVHKLSRDVANGEELRKEAENGVDKEKYYIVTPEKKVFGPYDSSEKSTFSINENTNQVENVEIVSDMFNSYVKGLFYEKTEEGYKIWNKDGTKTYKDVVDYAEPISNNAMKIKKDGKMGVVNKNLELVLYGDFEDVTNVIDQHAYVKQDDKWKLIEIELDKAELQKIEKNKEIMDSYKKEIQKLRNFDVPADCLLEYAIYDLDKDDTPELLVRTGHGEYDYMLQIYTYGDDECTLIGETGAGHSMFEWDSAKEGILKNYGSMGNQVITQITKKDGALIEKEIFSKTDGSMTEYIRHELIKFYDASNLSGFNE